MITRVSGINFTNPAFKANLKTNIQYTKEELDALKGRAKLVGSDSDTVTLSFWYDTHFQNTLNFKTISSKTTPLSFYELGKLYIDSLIDFAPVNFEKPEIKFQKQIVDFKYPEFDIDSHHNLDDMLVVPEEFDKNTIYYYQNGNKAIDIKTKSKGLQQSIIEFYTKNGNLKYKKYCSFLNHGLYTDVYKDDGKTIDYSIVTRDYDSIEHRWNTAYIIKDNKYILDFNKTKYAIFGNTKRTYHHFFEVIPEAKVSQVKSFDKDMETINSFISRYIDDEFSFDSLDNDTLLLLVDSNSDLLNDKEKEALDRLMDPFTTKQTYIRYEFNSNAGNYGDQYNYIKPDINFVSSLKGEEPFDELKNNTQHQKDMYNIATNLKRQLYKDAFVFQNIYNTKILDLNKFNSNDEQYYGLL